MLVELEKYYEDGLLLKQYHPTLDLTIWNYSPKVQYDRLWDQITIQCRGLVTNSEGIIVARPFKKFFNYEELTPEQIPNETFDVFDKMDGSLGILFNYKDTWVMATRGSFTSPQAIKGMEMLGKYSYDRLFDDYTYLFEIIYNDNRIVCQYDYEDLVLLGVIETETGYEVPIHYTDNTTGMVRFANIFRMLGFKIVKNYNGVNDYKSLKSTITDDEEGRIVRFKNGLRMKMKGDEYCRLHRIVTNVSNRTVWEYLKDNKPFDELLDRVPDEFYGWVKDTIKDMETKFMEILGEVITDYWEIDEILNEEQLQLGNNMVYDEREYMKRFAEESFKKNHPHLLLSYRKDTLSFDETYERIWKKLYPSYSKPFKNEIN